MFSLRASVSCQKDERLITIIEFELVTQALWTDPGDQSGWIYHRWLIGTSELLNDFHVAD